MQLKNTNQAIIFMLLFFLFGCGKEYYSIVKITNNSGYSIDNVFVSVTGEKVLVSSEKEGNTTYFEFEIQNEGSLVISVLLSNGKRIESEGVYITKGFNTKYEYVIQNNVVILIESDLGV